MLVLWLTSADSGLPLSIRFLFPNVSLSPSVDNLPTCLVSPGSPSCIPLVPLLPSLPPPSVHNARPLPGGCPAAEQSAAPCRARPVASCSAWTVSGSTPQCCSAVTRGTPCGDHPPWSAGRVAPGIRPPRPPVSAAGVFGGGKHFVGEAPSVSL